MNHKIQKEHKCTATSELPKAKAVYWAQSLPTAPLAVGRPPKPALGPTQRICPHSYSTEGTSPRRASKGTCVLFLLLPAAA